MNDINWAILSPIIILQLLLMVVALINCLRAERTNGPKWMWTLIILFISLLGPIAYFVFGRRND
ncbi:PLD nuclease N-terminal domain-containing protein [Paenibacillus roseipurpureus]|uniref:PLD nuclease N-terminal domain-containing protein n=1 Tax=Paenibacillus roseopurpureus TaxID=2918901 RepID=A0AA96LQI3_9BACL|nr:PLD nuclease N-terminal domain-containing protein [Paenibacillus sp. MBLB1832]WNR45398.1 PLD nuclease N-terminal domain-containing protein [Paenibacillus sp. MBLB1832]